MSITPKKNVYFTKKEEWAFSPYFILRKFLKKLTKALFVAKDN